MTGREKSIAEVHTSCSIIFSAVADERINCTYVELLMFTGENAHGTTGKHDGGPKRSGFSGSQRKTRDFSSAFLPRRPDSRGADSRKGVRAFPA